MGHDLSNRKGEFYFNTFGWFRILKLACKYGCVPYGTQAPPWMLVHDKYRSAYFDWDGDYSSKTSGQIVAAEDANSLVEALEKALSDIPDEECLSEYDTLPDGTEIEGTFDGNLHGVTLSQIYSVKMKDHLNACIIFCREGEFDIF